MHNALCPTVNKPMCTCIPTFHPLHRSASCLESTSRRGAIQISAAVYDQLESHALSVQQRQRQHQPRISTTSQLSQEEGEAGAQRPPSTSGAAAPGGDAGVPLLSLQGILKGPYASLIHGCQESNLVSSCHAASTARSGRRSSSSNRRSSIESTVLMAAGAHALATARSARRSSASARRSSVESAVMLAGAHALASSTNSFEGFGFLLHEAAQHSARTSCDGLQAGEEGPTPGGAAGGLLAWPASVRRMLHIPGFEYGAEEAGAGGAGHQGAREASRPSHGIAPGHGDDVGGLEAWQYCGETELKGRVATLETYLLQVV